jgi:ABC-type transport system involved in multi-copper enzyme maturation permease subunit
MKNIRQHILSFRLHVALLLTVLVFGFGTAAFVNNHRADMRQYNQSDTSAMENLRRLANSNLSRLATNRQTISLRPGDTAFITDARERYIPGQVTFSAFNVYGFSVRGGASNPYLPVVEDLNWGFIGAMIVSFLVLLLSFDAISGERESQTLALIYAGGVSRVAVLAGALISAIVIAMIVLLIGMSAGLVIVIASGITPMYPGLFVTLGGFLGISTVFVACLAAFGLFTSVVARSSRVSLLIALAGWLLFVAAIPNTALIAANTLFSNRSADAVNEEASRTRSDINKSAPPGSWASSGDNPFLPQHELRAANQTNLMNAEKRIRDDYYLSLFRQFERVRLLASLSPISLYNRLTEAVTGGGYVRFMKNWNDLHAFQGQFLAWFKAKDAQDQDSPHWYNPFEDYSTSKKPVAFEEVPIFHETPLTSSERFRAAAAPLALLSLYTVVLFGITFVLFARYDVR